MAQKTKDISKIRDWHRPINNVKSVNKFLKGFDIENQIYMRCMVVPIKQNE